MNNKTKYHSETIYFDGIKFDSKDELLYYKYLLDIKKTRNIQIELQPKFELIPNYVYQGKKHRGITYTADFKVTDEYGDVAIIDIKGMETQQGNMRRKMFEYKYPDKNLLWISRNIKYGKDGWVEYDELKKIRSRNKKEKNNGNI